MNEIEVPEEVTVAALANLTSIPAARLIRTAFEDLGRMLTINEVLPFDDTRALLGRLGLVARRRRE